VIQEVHRVAASGHVRLSALSKATEFTRGSCKPEFAVLAQFELGILHGGAGAGINNGVGGPIGMGRPGQEVVDSFVLFCLDACLVAARWALCCWRRRWPALLVRAW